jgi:hypothetical protein
MNPAACVELLLLPELARWKALDPPGGRRRERLLARDAPSFSRGALLPVAGWLAQHAGVTPTWVWAVGDAHHQHFTTLASGRLRRDGLPAVGYGVNLLDQQHPAPWHWDLLRLAASVADSRTLRPGELAGLVAAMLGDYLRCWERIADGDGEAALRIDLPGLPEALKRRIEADSAPAAYAAHLRRHCRAGGGAPRLARAALMTDDPAGAAELGRRFALAMRLRPGPEHELIDLVRLGGRDAQSGDERGWLGLLRERERTGGWRLRLIALRRRQPRVLPRLLPQLAAGPRAALPALAAGRADPYQRELPDPVRPYLARSWCHARHPLALRTLDAGDLRRLAQLWGQLLAGFHAEGLCALGLDPGPRAAAIRSEAGTLSGELAGLAGALSRFTARAHALFAARLRRPVRPRRAAGAG